MPAMYKIAKVDRPREKLRARGADAIATKELLAILLGSGVKGQNVLAIAEKILKLAHTGNIADLSLEILEKVSGIGHAKASIIVAAIELGKRCLSQEENKPSFISAKDVYDYFDHLRNAKKEHFICLCLNAKNKLIKEETVAIGGLFSNLLHPREIFVPAISSSTASIILAHNHPSGDPEPSKEDLSFTKRIAECGVLLGIEVLDHIIIGYKSFVSLRERGIFQ